MEGGAGGYTQGSGTSQGPQSISGEGFYLGHDVGEEAVQECEEREDGGGLGRVVKKISVEKGA